MIWEAMVPLSCNDQFVISSAVFSLPTPVRIASGRFRWYINWTDVLYPMMYRASPFCISVHIYMALLRTNTSSIGLFGVCQQIDTNVMVYSLRWRHNGHDSVSNHQLHHCLLNRLFGCRSKNISKLRVTGLCEGNSPVTGEFPAQMVSNAENVSIWWRHHVFTKTKQYHK